MDDNKRKPNNIGAWIPQLFYDIIARIIPGFFILLILLINVLDADQFINYLKKILLVDNTYDLSTNLLILFGIGISYIFAIILRAISCMVLHPIYKIKGNTIDPESESESKELSWKDIGLIENNCKTNEIALRYDFIKIKDIVNGNRITKLKAEVQMSGILFIGLLISSITNSIMMFFDYSISRLIILFCTLFISIFCYRAKKHFNDRLKIAVHNCSELLGFRKYLNDLINIKKPTQSNVCT